MIHPNEGGPISNSQINVNDVLCGRGTKHCNQAGNIMYHTLVRNFIVDYARAKKKNDKTEISKAIVDAIRNASPRGRFLNKGIDGFLHEIGDKKAWEKTSQLLRETVMMGSHRTMYQKRKWDQQRKKKAMSPMPSPVSVEQDVSLCTRTSASSPATTRGIHCHLPAPQVPLVESLNVPQIMSSSSRHGAPASSTRPHLNAPFAMTTYPYRTAASTPPAVFSTHHQSTYVSRPPPMPPVTYPPRPLLSPMIDIQHSNAHTKRTVSNGGETYRPPASTQGLGPVRTISGSSTSSYVDRLRTELSSWPVQPSPATIAELEVIARYQDATYLHNNGNANNDSTAGCSPPLWGANH